LSSLVAAQAADCMRVVKLFTASSISRLDFSLTLRFTCSFNIFWNCKRLVWGENNLGVSVRVSGVAEILSSTKNYKTIYYKLLGIFVTKMSRISGFFLRDEGQ